MVPIVIYDFRVLAFKVMHTMDSFHLRTILDNLGLPITAPNYDKLYKSFARAAWGYLLNRGPLTTDYFPHIAVVVDDNSSDRQYWRKDYYPNYKANRKTKLPHYYDIVYIGLEYVNSIKNAIYYFNLPGYEADDFAGAFVHAKRLDQSLGLNKVPEIHLYTVDSDWLQLVGNGVLWHNTGPWTPLIRGHEEAILWTKKRLKADITHPQQIVDVKMRQGDKSDNLPPGSPRYLIDLINLHPEWMLWNRHPDTWSAIKHITIAGIVNSGLEDYHKSKEWLMKIGCTIT